MSKDVNNLCEIQTKEASLLTVKPDSTRGVSLALQVWRGPFSQERPSSRPWGTEGTGDTEGCPWQPRGRGAAVPAPSQAPLCGLLP